jgi:hypothetical protein
MALTPIELTLIVIVVLLGIALGFVWTRYRRSEKLKSKYGPEYARVVREEGTRRKAEAALEQREERVASFKITPLPPERRAEFIEAWRKIQSQFVDDPHGAVTHADVLLGEIMETRGYPVADFEQRSADLSVDHPEVVQNYRVAHDIALRHARREAGTEDLRQAMLHYRALFDDLVNEPSGDHEPRVKKIGERIRD